MMATDAATERDWWRRVDLRHWWQVTRRDVRLVARVYRLSLTGSGRRGVLLFLGVLFQASIPVAQIWLTRSIVDSLADGDQRRAMIAGSVMAGLLFASAVVKPAQDVLATRVQDRGVANTELALIRAGARLRDMVRISDPAWRERMGPVRQAAQYFSMVVTQASRWYASSLALIGILLSLVTLHPLIPLSLVATGVASHLMLQKQYDLEYATMWKLARTGGEMDYTKWIATRPESAAEARMFGIGPWLRARYRRLADRSLAEVGDKRKRGALWAIGGSLLYVVTLAGSFWYVARRAEAGTVSIGDLALFVNALIQAQALTANAFRTFAELHDLANKAGDFFPFIDDATSEITVAEDGDTPSPVPATGIAMRDVAFTYPHDDREILHDVSLDLPAGSVTALVGDNGAGKSTLVNLLGRMFDPTRGTICLDGIPYPDLDLTALRDRIAVVYQDAAHFALPLEENIAIGLRDFTWLDPGPGTACAREIGRQLGVDDIAATLPHGYRTGLTRAFDSSVELSGGQWQLVIFARGLVRNDAALAMLDEPSSALDPVREAEQIGHIRRYAAARRRSVLLISHRLSTVRWADQIAVLDGGRIIEAGSHEALMTRDGIYADLFRMQSSRYR